MSSYHQGELAVQQRAGVAASAARIGGSIRGEFPPVAAEFLAARTLVVAATGDAEGRPWASALTGRPGFARVSDPRTVRIEHCPADGDPLEANLRPGAVIGLLAVDFETRRRIRVNGRVRQIEGGIVTVETDQIYSNCPKYIQRRVAAESTGTGAAGQPQYGRELTAAQRGWIRRADTFFVATLNPGEGADASHRGGAPGFVGIEGGRILWPDYAGNTMFNTLGNIAAWPRAGLLFPDFTNGRVLQVGGRAGIEWGADRAVYLEVEQVIERAGVLPERQQLVEYSPFNPPAVLP